MFFTLAQDWNMTTEGDRLLLLESDYCHICQICKNRFCLSCHRLEDLSKLSWKDLPVKIRITLRRSTTLYLSTLISNWEKVRPEKEVE
jgi:hypothetical protein